MKIATVSFFILFSTGFALAQRNQDVVIYDDPNFQGVNEALRESDPDLRNNVVGDGQLQSIRVPPGAVVTLFEKRRYRGKSVTLTRNVSNIATTSIGAGTVSSIRIEWDEVPRRRTSDRGRNRQAQPLPDKDLHPLDDPRHADKVLIFSESHFRGRWDALDEDAGRLRYTEVGNDAIRSIAIPDGFEVTLYEHSRFRGRSETLTYDDTNLENNPIGLDAVSSIRIARTDGPVIVSEPVLNDTSEPPTIAERGGVTLYRDKYFRGEELRILYSIPDLGETPIGNDSLSSLRIPQGWEVTLFEHEEYRGRSFTVTYDFNNLSASRFGDDTASSLKVQRVIRKPPPEVPLPPARGLVVLYEHDDYRGQSIAIKGNIADLGRTKLGNDRLSSFRVPAGYEITLYEGVNFRGPSETFSRDITDMDQTKIGNDRVRSIRVKRVNPR